MCLICDRIEMIKQGTNPYFVKELDTAAGKGILTKNSVSRKKSRMMKLYNASFNAAN